jgi:hypothetical protein
MTFELAFDLILIRIYVMHYLQNDLQNDLHELLFIIRMKELNSCFTVSLVQILGLIESFGFFED